MAKKDNSWKAKGSRIGGNIGAIATKVKNILEDLNVEHKYKDELITQAPDNTGYTYPLCSIGQGDTPILRSGNSIKLTSFLMRYSLALNAATPTNCLVRVLLFRDNQQAPDSTPAIGSVLESIDPVSPMDMLLNVGRYSVLYDKTHSLTTVATPQTNVIKVYKKMNSLVKYNGNDSTDIQRNGLYIGYLSNLGATLPVMTMRTRIRFVDN